MALASDPSFTLPAEPSRWQQELPPGAWREVLLHLAPEQRFVAAMVCQAWRSHALSLLTPDLEVCLNSGAAAAGFSHWLHAHGQQLHSLTITEYYFSHHGHHGPQGPAQGGVLRSRLGQIARVQLWQGLHSFGKPLRQLHTLKVKLDDISPADAVAIGLCVMPSLTHLTLESNASAIGVTGAAGLVPLTSLRELVLPSQALGDQGLQYIGNSLVNLQAMSLYNDGHVSDDGLAALAGLRCLTSLDLQGNVSITQSAMPALAAAGPRLRSLNMSWLAMVNDWGLGQLSSLVDMQDLNLRATGVQLESPLALAALRCFSALTRLDLTRCRITAAGIVSVAAAATPGLCVLSLAENAGLQSYTELQPLQQLSRLTRLDLSSPAAAMRLPACQHTAVCQLTQLRHLALNCVIRTNRNEDLRFLGEAHPEESLHNILSMQGSEPGAEVLVAAPIAAALGHHQQGAAGAVPAAAAAAGQASSTCADPWAALLLSLPSLTHLTALEFAGNAGSLFLASRSNDPEYLRHLLELRTREPALLLLAFAAAGHTALKTVHFSNADHHHHAPHVALVRGHTGGLLSGRWNEALPAVATSMLLTVGAASQPAQQRQLGAAERQPDAAEGTPAALPPLSAQLESLQVVGSDSGSGSQQGGGGGGGGRGWVRELSPAQRRRLRALVDQVWDVQQNQPQQQNQQQDEVACAVAGGGAQSHPENPAGSLQQPSACLLSEAEAVEALQLLLPGLASLHFPW